MTYQVTWEDNSSFKCALIAFLIFLPFTYNANSQDTAVEDAKTEQKWQFDNTPDKAQNDTGILDIPMSSLEFKLSLWVLIFGMVVLVLEVILIRLINFPSETALKFIIITLIVTATLFLITAGYSNDQIAPAVGLLGTIAGYLLGRGTTQSDNSNHTS